MGGGEDAACHPVTGAPSALGAYPSPGHAGCVFSNSGNRGKKSLNIGC